MIETVIGCVMLGGAGVGLLAAIYKRCNGLQVFGNWRGGGTITFTGQIAVCVFIGSIGAAFLHHSAIWTIPALAAWLVGYLSQKRANRRHQTEEEELRKTNALEYPGVFDHPPPTDLEATPGDRLDLYDAGACTFIGSVNKSDIIAAIDVLADMPDQGPNDIFVIHESLEIISESHVTEEFTTLLNAALTHRDYVVLRWMPQTQKAR